MLERIFTDPVSRQRLLRRGLQLEYATLIWNIGEATLILIAAARARSVALTGFGLDSVIEIFASVAVVWQLKGGRPERERRALRLIGVAFFGIAAYVLAASAHTFAVRAHSHTSVLGMTSLAATSVGMAGLGLWKGRVGKRLNHRVLRTEARVTLTDAYLAASILIGLALNATFKWWWADPAAALVIVFYGIKEGRGAWSRHE